MTRLQFWAVMVNGYVYILKWPVAFTSVNNSTLLSSLCAMHIAWNAFCNIYMKIYIFIKGGHFVWYKQQFVVVWDLKYQIFSIFTIKTLFIIWWYFVTFGNVTFFIVTIATIHIAINYFTMKFWVDLKVIMWIYWLIDWLIKKKL